MNTNIKIELTGFCEECPMADIVVKRYPEDKYQWRSIDEELAKRKLFAYCTHEAVCRMWAEKAVKA